MPTTHDLVAVTSVLVGFDADTGGELEATSAFTFGGSAAVTANAIITAPSTLRVTFGGSADLFAFSIRPIPPTALTLTAATDETLTLTPA